MQYILVEFPDGFQGYQEVCSGNVQRYTDLIGNTLDRNPSCRVVDPVPVQPEWALVSPEPLPVPRTTNNITKLQYMSRFADQELAAIYTAAKSVIQLEIWLEKFKLAEFIDVSDPTTVAGLQALESGGLLAAGRAAEILNA